MAEEEEEEEEVEEEVEEAEEAEEIYGEMTLCGLIFKRVCDRRPSTHSRDRSYSRVWLGGVTGDDLKVRLKLCPRPSPLS